MATAGCACCGILGRQTFNQHTAILAGPPLVKRRLITYNMGHGQTTTDENVAKKALLERDFKEIAHLESISQSEFRHGMIGAKFLPGVFISKIPRVVEPSAYNHHHKTKKSNIGQDEHEKNLQIMIEQSGEKPIFDGLVGMGRACFFWLGSSPSQYFLDRVEPGLQNLYLEPMQAKKNSV